MTNKRTIRTIISRAIIKLLIVLILIYGIICKGSSANICPVFLLVIKTLI